MRRIRSGESWAPMGAFLHPSALLLNRIRPIGRCRKRSLFPHDLDQSTLSDRRDGATRKFFAAAVGSVVALVGFAGAANASAQVDLIWIDVSVTATGGSVICLKPAKRNCVQLGTTLSSVAVSDNITLAVILTAGPGDSLGGGVSVDYNEFLPTMSVVGFQSLKTTIPFRYLPGTAPSTTNQPPFIDSINAHALFGFGIGLPSGVSAYLGTVTFHKDAIVDGEFEIKVGTNGPGQSDDVVRLSDFTVITGTTTFNSAFLVILPTDPPSGKVTMCHKGKHSISASANAVPAHLAHGDTLGACP